MGSITSWIRLEPQCRDTQRETSLQARIHDPFWLLARQWQMGEFQGEDTGSPVCARWRGDSAPITRFHAGSIRPNTRENASHYDTRTMPLEVRVECQPLSGPDQQGSLRQAVESGLHFLRMLDAQPTSRRYRDEFLQLCALRPPTTEQLAAADPETRSWWNLMARRAPDARRLAALLRDPAGSQRTTRLPAELPIAPADRAEIEHVISAWLAQHDALLTVPDPTSSTTWQTERLEHAFSISAAPGGVETPLTASEYAHGHLDWYSVDSDPEINLGAASDQASKPLVRTVMPTPVSFRGMPASRFWEMEDRAIDFGLLDAAPGDLPRLMLSEFITWFGNEWYVIPIDLDVGTLTTTRSLVITDSFGVQSLITPVNDPARSASGWSMFELSGIERPGLPPLRPHPNLLFLAPALVKTLESRSLEEVLFMRDEMANVAWAIEQVTQGGIENRVLPPTTTSSTSSVAPAPTVSGPVLHYRLSTEVPANWIPLLPQRVGEPPSLRLVKAAMLDLDGSNQIQHARSELLQAAVIKLFDEEIPREGIKVTRQFKLTRWIDGRTWLWMALRKQVGRGEGGSELKFDQAQS